MKQWQFGTLLRLNEEVDFNAGVIRPLPTFKEVQAWLDENLHRDGFFYPPMVANFRSQFDVEKREWTYCDDPEPNTEKPAHLYALIPTHELHYTGVGTDDRGRLVASILLQALSFFFGTRLQFADWLTDLRVKVKTRGPFYVRPQEVPHIMNLVYEKAVGLDDKDRLLLHNILAIHNRTGSYNWMWERFLWSYNAFDACWWFLKRERGVHGKRIKVLCDELGIPDAVEERRAIVRLRNELVHEVCWDEGRYGSDGTVVGGAAVFNLKKLVDRILLHVLDIPCEARTTTWLSRSWFALDPQ